MKNLFIINTHSFVDLITNSSTELYICDAKKTTGAVKQILVKLLETHNEMMNTNYLFENVFKEPEVSKYHFSYYNVPVELRDEYEEYCEHGCPYDRGSFVVKWNEPKNPRVQRLEALERKIPRADSKLYDTNKEEYDRIWKESREKEDALWTNFGAGKILAEGKIFVEFLKQNNVSEELIALAKKELPILAKKHKKAKKGKYAHFNFESKELSALFEQFDFIHGWGLNINPNAVMIYGTDDNSIPYEMMDSLSSYLNASRHHLG